MSRTRTVSSRGSALLSVLWLTAALSAIALTIATSVRGETERTATEVEAIRAHYLACGAIHRALLYVQWGPSYTGRDGKSRFYTWGTPYLYFEFPTGRAEVRIAPESSKINVNTAKPEEIFRLLTVLGVDDGRARLIIQGILERRTPPTQPNFPGPSTFLPRPASFEEIEEVLSVPGMTPELFYGGYQRDAAGRMSQRLGFKEYATVYGAGGAVDVNTADSTMLALAGVPEDVIPVLIERRNRMPFQKIDELGGLIPAGPGGPRLTIGGSAIFTLRATASMRLPDGRISDLRRSVAATMKFLDPSKFQDRYHILRWYDNVWVQ